MTDILPVDAVFRQVLHRPSFADEMPEGQPFYAKDWWRVTEAPFQRRFWSWFHALARGAH